MLYPNRSTVLLCFLLALIDCSGKDPVSPPAQQKPVQPSLPRVLSATLVVNPNNVLSAVLTFSAEQADSARVVFRDQNQAVDSTPYVGVTAGSDTIVTLGLRPGTSYRNVVEVKGSAGSAVSDTLFFTTSALPELLSRLTVATTGTTRGLTLGAFQIGGNDIFALAFDSAGQIRWYRRFQGSEVVGGELKQQRNGHFTLYRGESHGSQKVPGAYIEFSPAGDSLRAISVPAPRYVDNHDLVITAGADGQERFHFFTYDYRPSELVTRHGTPVSLAGHQLVRLRADATTEFEWNAWNHFTLDDWIEPKPAALPSEYDFDHPNSIELDGEGNYILSFRRLSQIVKLDATTGDVIWRMGGRRSEFTIVDDPMGGFSNQHSARVLPNGHLLIYDNGGSHSPQESRAVEYEVDTSAKTAKLVWQYRHEPAIYTPGGGAVQRLGSGNTFIAFSQAGRASEVAADGIVLWEADLRVDGRHRSIYRLARIASLYRYETP